jgi:hypothetical protein
MYYNSEYLIELKKSIQLVKDDYQYNLNLKLDYEKKQLDDWLIINKNPLCNILPDNWEVGGKILKKAIKKLKELHGLHGADTYLLEFHLNSRDANKKLKILYSSQVLKHSLTLKRLYNEIDNIYKLKIKFDYANKIQNAFLDAKYNPKTPLGKKYVNALYDENF